MKAVRDLSDQELENRLKGVWKKTGGPKVKVKAPAEEPTPEPPNGTENDRATAPLSPLGDGPPEQPAESGDRDAKGRFAKGWKGGPGNPFGRKLAELRSALVNAVTGDDMKAIAEGLVKKARMGFPFAIKILFLYCIGRPTEPVNPDRVDLDEWNLLDASPTRTEMIRAMVDSVPPEVAADFFREFLSKTVKDQLNLGVSEVENVIYERARRRKK